MLHGTLYALVVYAAAAPGSETKRGLLLPSRLNGIGNRTPCSDWDRNERIQEQSHQAAAVADHDVERMSEPA
jgi:hypothetical protein